MTDLYKFERFIAGDGMPGFRYVEVSRSDVLEWLGWEECGDCSGSNCKWDGDHGTRDCEPCDYCLDGLAPPAHQVDAAAFPILDTLAMSWHKQLGITHEEAVGREDFKEMATTVARAALIAAMKAVSDD